MAKRKSTQPQPQLEFTAREPRHGDLVKRKDWPSTYQISQINYGGKTVTLCLMHGGRTTNFELLNIPIENLIWLD